MHGTGDRAIAGLMEVFSIGGSDEVPVPERARAASGAPDMTEAALPIKC